MVYLLKVFQGLTLSRTLSFPLNFRLKTSKLLTRNLSRMRENNRLTICIVFIFVLMGWSLLPNALRTIKIYCAHPNLGITGT